MNKHDPFKYVKPNAPTESGLYYPQHLRDGVWTYCYYLGSIALSTGDELDLGVCDNCGTSGVLSATTDSNEPSGYRSFPVVNYDDDYWDKHCSFSESFTEKERERIRTFHREYNAALYQRAERHCFPVHSSYENERNGIVHKRLVYDSVNGFNNTNEKGNDNE